MKHALFRKDTFHLGATLSLGFFSRSPTGGLITRVTAFQEAYRIILNSFPLLFPADVPISLNLRNLAKKLFSSHSTLTTPLSTTRYHKAHQTWLRRRAARWHSIVVGCCCRWHRDITREPITAEGYRAATIRPASAFIVQFVLPLKLKSNNSGLQGSYSAYSEKCGFRVQYRIETC